MKVAYVLHDTDQFGGANRSFILMLYALVQKGIEPLVVLPDKKGIYNELHEKDIDTLVLDYRPNTYPYEDVLKDYLLWVPRLIARRIVNAIAARQLSRAIAGFDIVHTNVSIIDIGARAARRQGIPHVYHFREYADKDFKMRYFPCKQRFYSSVQYAICVTRDIRAYHQLPTDTRVIYDAIIDNSTPCFDALPDTPAYLLYAGRLEQSKGIEDLLEAYASSMRKIPLWIAGSAPQDDYQERLEQLCSQLGIRDRVRFLGNRSDVLSLMANARAIVIPSHHEAFGRIMPEAMHQHCLTIGRDSDGLHEQFENGLQLSGGEIGLRFRDISELTKLIDAVSTTAPDHWTDYTNRAFLTVNHLYTLESCASGVSEYYQLLKHQ